MTIRHHLSDDLLMAYAAGELPEAFSLVVATHVSLCDTCRAQAATYDVLGGAVVETQEAAKLSDGALDACLARIAAPTVRPERPAPRRCGDVPAPLASYLDGDLAQVRWRPVGKGVKQAVLATADRKATVRLLSIPGGVAVPDHGHRGLELTLVLQGAFADETGRFGPGDVEVAGDDLEHTPVAEPGETCICLAATDAPLRFRGLLPRLAQPFVGI